MRFRTAWTAMFAFATVTGVQGQTGHQGHHAQQTQTQTQMPGQAAQGQAMQKAPEYDPSQETTISGTLQQIIDEPRADAWSGTRLVIDTAQGPVTVYVGPANILRGSNFQLSQGDGVEITGAPATFEGQRAMVARDVTRGKSMLTVRSRTGDPMWTIRMEPVAMQPGAAQPQGTAQRSVAPPDPYQTAQPGWQAPASPPPGTAQQSGQYQTVPPGTPQGKGWQAPISKLPAPVHQGVTTQVGPATAAAPGVAGYDPATDTSLVGTVREVTTTQDGHTMVSLWTTSGPVDVILGPQDFVQQRGLVMEPGRRIEIRGAMSSVSGQPVMLAREVRTGAQVVTLRSPSGQPEWIQQPGAGTAARAAETTVSGIVQNVERIDHPSGWDMLHLTLQTSAGPVRVRMPSTSIQQQRLPISVGDQLTVIGMRLDDPAGMSLLAREVSSGGEVISYQYPPDSPFLQGTAGTAARAALPVYNSATETEIEGRVEALKQFVGPRGETITVATIRNNRGLTDVHLAPQRALDQQNIRISRGDRLKVTGSMVPYAGTYVVIARELRDGDRTVALRGADGSPVWMATGAPAVAQQQGAAQGTTGTAQRMAAPVYDPANESTISGTLQSVSEFSYPDGRSIMVATVNTSQGPVNVLLGPADFLEQQNLRIEIGDPVTVTGSRTAGTGAAADMFIARQVMSGQRSIMLRSDTGVPMWPESQQQQIPQQ